jgi:putative oxidoreductase
MSNPVTTIIRKSLAVDRSTGASSWGLLVLRVATGSLIFYVHGWHKLLGGIAYLQKGTPWKLVEEVAEMHLPAPLTAAFAATAVQFVCSLFVVAGLFTRINAALLTAALAGAVFQNLVADRDPQLALLYTLNVITLLVAGGGCFSLDAKWFNRPPRK